MLQQQHEKRHYRMTPETEQKKQVVIISFSFSHYFLIFYVFPTVNHNREEHDTALIEHISFVQRFPIP